MDPFGGRADVEGKRIRVLHDRSFMDDPTRIFRAVRFEGRLGFRMDDSTERKIRDALASGILERLEDYRLVAELDLILKEEGSRRMILRLESLGVLGTVRTRARGSRLLRKTLNEIESAAGRERSQGS
jgi:tRNA nucleotidyltransferase (CCA-adding enzyme)